METETVTEKTEREGSLLINGEYCEGTSKLQELSKPPNLGFVLVLLLMT